MERDCTICQDYRICLKLQLDYDNRRRFNETNEIPHTPESFFRFMPEKCGSFKKEEKKCSS